MPRRAINFAIDEHYHVYNRGHNRQPIFLERDNQLFFLRRVREYLEEHAAVVAYCLMPNHYHLLVKLRSPQFSTAMQRFGVSYAKAINKRYARVGSLFQGPFQALHVDQEEYLVHLTRYIHLNPVAAGFVRKPEQWEFSSYLDYLGWRHGTLPQRDWVWTVFRTPQEYQRFVTAGIDKMDAPIKRFVFAEQD